MREAFPFSDEKDTGSINSDRRPALPPTKRSRTSPTGVASLLSKLGRHALSKVT